MNSADKSIFKIVDQRIDTCFSSSKSVPKPWITVPSIMDGINILEGAEYFLVIYLFPIISFAGFLSNILIILIIRNKANQKALFKNEKEESNHRFYELIILGSAFNAAECFIVIFSLINICLGPNSLFCSSIMEEEESQYFKVIVIGHFSETLKTCSILFSIVISFERYILVSITKAGFVGNSID